MTVAFASTLAYLANEIEAFGFTPENAARLGKELGSCFNVGENEVGILRLEGINLVFCHPASLQLAGSIPLNASTSVAARTATSCRAEIINNFAQVEHISEFETVYLGATSQENAQDKSRGKAQPIQKMMSAPVRFGDRVCGVIQVSRKGATPAEAGADFTGKDLAQLTAAISSIGRCFA